MRSKLKKLKKNIAVLMGGYSDEFEISIKSGNNIFQNIDTKLFNPYSVIIEKNNWRVTNEGKEYAINETDFSFKIGKNKIQFQWNENFPINSFFSSKRISLACILCSQYF